MLYLKCLKLHIMCSRCLLTKFTDPIQASVTFFSFAKTLARFVLTLVKAMGIMNLKLT